MKLYRNIIILIFLLGAIYRLGFYDEIIFKEDDNSSSLYFYNLVKNSQFPPLLAKGKSGLYSLRILDAVPWYVIVLFIKDPRIITILYIGVPNTLAIILCFFFCYRFINKRTALVATGLFSFSGWNILHSRGLWVLNLQPFYTILLFSFLLYFVYYHRPWAIVSAVLLSLLIYELHATSLSLIISVFLILLAYGYIYKKKFLLPLLLTSIILTIPFLFVIKKVNIFTPSFNLRSFIYPLKLITRDHWYYNHLRIPPEFPLFENFNTVFLRAIFIFGCIYIIKRMFHSLRIREFSPHIVIGAWFFSFLIGFGFTAMRYHSHYFVVVFPALSIITATGFDSLINYILGREKISPWEIFLTLSIFAFWNPFIILLIIAIMLLRNIKVNRKPAVSSLNVCMIFILSLQGITTLRLYNSIMNSGGVSGVPKLDLGSKINAARFVIQDAKERHKQTGLTSGYSIEIDKGYEYQYLFEYLTEGEMDFLSDEKPSKGFHYRIIGDVNKELVIEENKDYISHKRIGSKVIIVEKIDEK